MNKHSIHVGLLRRPKFFSLLSYGPEDNKVKVPIGSWDGWIRQEIASSSEDEDDAKENDRNDDALVRVVHSGGHGRIIDTGSGG